MADKVVETLRETNRFRNKRLANRIEKERNRKVFGGKEYQEMVSNQNKAYKLFLRLIDKDSRERLKALDDTIESIATQIHKESGWWMTQEGFMFRDNFQNMDDPEFRSFDTYRIYRGENGYSVTPEKPYNHYYATLHAEEERFYKKYEEKLRILHEALTEKERIMAGEYTVEDEANLPLCKEITAYLGYTPEKLQKKGKK